MEMHSTLKRQPRDKMGSTGGWRAHWMPTQTICTLVLNYSKRIWTGHRPKGRGEQSRLFSRLHSPIHSPTPSFYWYPGKSPSGDHEISSGAFRGGGSPIRFAPLGEPLEEGAHACSIPGRLSESKGLSGAQHGSANRAPPKRPR